jgi:SAM-dependent methyltransferase
MLKTYQDAYGHEIYDHYKGINNFEIVERDDGYIEVGYSPRLYFSEYGDWHIIEKKAIRYVKGRVLDIGCGAGRHILYLQQKGHQVTGIDSSPLAVKVCRKRGVKDVRLMPITRINPSLGVFGTIMMFGNNFGLFGNPQRAKWLLKIFKKITSPNGRIIAQSTDPYKTKLKEHLEYHRFNVWRGRLAGQLRIRIRYKKYITPWFDYLLVSKSQMKNILKGSGWQVEKFIDSNGPYYVAIIIRNN